MGAEQPGSNVRVEELEDHLRFSNPFDDNRVTQVDRLAGNVRQINESALAALQDHAQKSSRADKGRGVLVTGPPGIGKSHLLARFAQWARDEKYPFIYLLNLQAGAQDILPTIVRTTISMLTRDFRRAPGRTRLFKLVSMAVRRALDLYAKDPQQAPTIHECRRCYQRLLQHQNHEGIVDRVFWEFFQDIQLQISGFQATGRSDAARRWLAGEILATDEYQSLGIAAPAIGELSAAAAAEHSQAVLRVLCEFAGFRKRSLILCFDQVDTLAEDQVQAWSAAVHGLLDHCPGLLVVTSGVDETFLRWTRNQCVSTASWDDRIRQFPVVLAGIDSAMSRQLIQQRLDRFCEPFSELADVQTCRSQDATFPLGQAAVDALLVDHDGYARHDLRPREVICGAGRIWDRQAQRIHQDGIHAWFRSWTESVAQDNSPEEMVEETVEQAEASVDEAIGERLNEHLRHRRSNPESLPVDPGNLAGLLYRIFSACATTSDVASSESSTIVTAVQRHDRDGGRIPPFQLTLELRKQGRLIRTGIAVAEASQGVGLTYQLRRIHSAVFDDQLVDDVVLVSDARAPLRLGSVAQELMGALQQPDSPFASESLEFEQYIRLEGLEWTAGLARAGDLARIAGDGRQVPVTDSEVYQSHHRAGRYRQNEFLQLLLGRNAAGEGLAENADGIQQQDTRTVPSWVHNSCS